jgi:hypothetical protein
MHEAIMDEMEILNYQGRRFLCSGGQLPSGSFQAVVRCKTSTDDLMQTITSDAGQHVTGYQALACAKALAMQRTQPRVVHQDERLFPPLQYQADSVHG